MASPTAADAPDGSDESHSEAGGPTFQYMTVKEVLERFARGENLAKVNVYGVISYLPTTIRSADKKDKCTPVTIVDQTCGLNDRLKLNVFSTSSERLLYESCEIGDIIRFHRLKIQGYAGNPQGVHLSQGSSWIRFKRTPTLVLGQPTTSAVSSEESSDLEYVGNRANNTIEEQDKKFVAELRKWLLTNPQVISLFEAGLSFDTTPQPLSTIGATSDSNRFISINSAAACQFSPPRCKLARIGDIAREGYYDIICQICAFGDCKGTRFLIVWDGTKSSQSFYQDTQFQLDKENVFFSSEALAYLYQVSVFDEFVLQLDALRPGDFVLLKNLCVKFVHINSQLDIVMKMPGITPQGVKYGRAITKLAPPLEADFNAVSENEMENRVRYIWKKGQEMKLTLTNGDEFMREYTKLESESFNGTLNELIQHNNAKQSSGSILSQVNQLLADDENAYVVQAQKAAVAIRQETHSNAGEKNLSNDVCDEIFRLKRLAKLTFFAPFFTRSIADELFAASLKFEPYFSSLADLADEAKKHKYLRCKVTAKLFNYSISSAPAIGSVFVCCKKCGYINFVPFHLANINQPGSLTMILKDQDETAETNETEVDMEEKLSRNFSYEWLMTAMPTDSFQMPTSQFLTQLRQVGSGDEPAQSYQYGCPRCEAVSDSRELSYIYRFWFILRDANSQLDKCLLEADTAASVLGSVEPIKFYTNASKSHLVYKTIHRNFDRKFLFTIETFRMDNSSDKQSHSNENTTRQLNMLYRILDMVEVSLT